MGVGKRKLFSLGGLTELGVTDGTALGAMLEAPSGSSWESSWVLLWLPSERRFKSTSLKGSLITLESLRSTIPLLFFFLSTMNPAAKTPTRATMPMIRPTRAPILIDSEEEETLGANDGSPKAATMLRGLPFFLARGTLYTVVGVALPSDHPCHAKTSFFLRWAGAWSLIVSPCHEVMVAGVLSWTPSARTTRPEGMVSTTTSESLGLRTYVCVPVIPSGSVAVRRTSRWLVAASSNEGSGATKAKSLPFWVVMVR
mmetsp:Transcript_32876/g.71119  ORF Transcript_32876/g.71119 Transcript_32876/m.71119 type:complete len:256 (-) Transcript_32876:1512-2279(-)